MGGGLPQWFCSKESVCDTGDAGDSGLIPGPRRSLGIGTGNPLQDFCLENSMDRGAWQGTVYGVAKSWTQLSNSAYMHRECEDIGFHAVLEGKPLEDFKHRVI